MDKYTEVRENLILTYHGKDNFYGNRKDCDRTDITVHQITSAIAFGVAGFAGNRRMIKTYKGVTVVYKVDKDGKNVVITYYKAGAKKKYKNKRRKSLTY